MHWGLWAAIVMAIVAALNRLRFTSTVFRTATLLTLALACIECGSDENPVAKTGAVEENVKEVATPLTVAPPSSSNLLAPLECLGPPLYNIGFGDAGQGTSSIAGYGIEPHGGSFAYPPTPALRLFDAGASQSDGMYVLAYKTFLGGSNLVTHHFPVDLPATGSLLPGGGAFDGTAAWLIYKPFKPFQVGEEAPSGPPPLNALSPPSLGRLANGSPGGATLNGIDFRTDAAHLVPITPVPNQVTRRSFIASTHIFTPTHASTPYRLYIGPYLDVIVQGSPFGLTSYGGTTAHQVILSSVKDSWSLLQVRVDIEVSGGTLAGSSDDTGSATYSHILNGAPDGSPQTFPLDPNQLTRATGPIRLGPHFFAITQGSAAELFVDNLTVSEVFTNGANCQAPNSGTCTTNADCTGGEVCGTDNGAYFARPATDDICWLPTCCTAQQPPNSSGTLLSKCGTCPSASCFNGVKDAGESDVDCGGNCGRCTSGKTCNDDCAPGLTCGHNNGGHFGLARTIRVCWSTDVCDDGVDSTECGQPNSICGSNCGGAVPCDPATPVCPAGEVCKVGLGQLFETEAPAVCVDPICPSDDPTKCGEEASLCGEQCICVPDCSSATAANPDDHCDGTCPHLCAMGQPCCTTDLNCPIASFCQAQPNGPGICRPNLCAYRHLAPPQGSEPGLCGFANAPCGEQCPACTPECDGRQCGLDSACGASCGSCGDGQFCDGNGQCQATVTSQPPVRVNSGQGGTIDIPVPPEAPTTPVGALSGQFSVSDEGTAQYNVPIQVPPGRADVEPVLSLRYGGTKSSGEAGIGWKIEGLSQITRCPRTYALDRYAAPIMNDHTDRFCLDGKRLEMVTDANAYGGHGTEYRTLIDSFNKVKSWWDPLPTVEQWNNVPLAELAERGPDYFEVWTKDGRKLTYGRTRDSLLAGRNGVRVAWLLNKVEDRSGNNMIVRYNNLRVEVPPQVADRVPNMVEPKAIFYTGHGSAAGDREVRFDYEGRGDFTVIYGQGGVPLLSARRLKRVTTFVEGVAVKNYRLDYESDQVSLIRKIFECAHGDDAQCKPPSEFDYENEHGFSYGNLSLGGEIGDVGQLDMNGDGLPDFLVVKAHVGPTPDLKLGWKIAFIVVDVGLLVLDHVYPPAGVPAQVGWSLGKGPLRGVLAGSPKVSFTGEVLKGTGNRNHPLDTLYDISGLPCQSGQTVFLDYDQDGKDDIVGSCSPGEVFVARALGDGNFAAMQTVESLPVLPVHARERPVPVPWPTLYDVNGDGLQDIVSCVTQSGMQVRLREGPAENFGPAIGFGNPLVPDLTNPGHQIRPRLPYCGDAVPTGQVWDVDGDGTPELLVRYRPTRAEAISSHRPSGWYALRYSLEAPQLRWDRVDLPDTGDSATGRGMQVADLNNDGLADIWRSGDANGNTNAPEATVWLNSGNGFLASTVPRPLPPLNTQLPIQLSTTLFVDHNADGRLDILEHWVGGYFGEEFNQVLHPDGTGLNLTASLPTDLKFFNEAEHATFAGRYGALGDIDADGNADLFGSSSQAYYGSGLRNMSLSKIKDGVGNTVHVYYDSQAYKATCAEALRWPVQCVKNLKGLVSRHTDGFEFANHVGGEIVERDVTYRYENGRIDVTGHGWLGFDKRTVTEQVVDQSRTVTVEFEPVRRFTPAGAETTGATPPYLYPLAGMPHATTVDATMRFGETQSPLEDAPHSRRTRSTQEWTVQLSAQGRPFPVLSSTETQTFSRRVSVLPGEIVPFDEDGDERTRCWDLNPEVDGYSNVRHNTKLCVAPHEVGQGGDSSLLLESLDTQTTYEPDASRWWISNPKELTITSKRNGASQTQNYLSEYDLDGLLHAVTRDPSGDAQRVVYTRDSQGFGSVEHITEDVSTGEAARVTDIVYDTDRYFPSSITNHVGGADLTTQIAIEPHFGQVAVVADANGVSVQNAYDGFGNKKEVATASGTTTYSYASLPFLWVESPAGRIHPRVEVTVSAQGTTGTFGGRSVLRLDNHGRVVQSTSVGFDGADLISERAFDDRGRVAAATSPHLLGAAVVPKAIYTYDYLDRVTRVENADGTYSEQQYASGVSLATSHQNWIADLACPSAVKGHCAVDVVLSIGTHQPLAEGVPVPAPGTPGAPKQNVGITDYAGLVLRTIDGEHVETATATSNFDYAPFSRLHHLYDNGGAQTSFVYDAYGRMLTHTDPDAGGSTTTYNGFGEVKTTTDANGVLRTFSYDTVGRLTSIQDPDDSISSWIYDVGPSALGRLSETISPPTQENPEGQHVVYGYEPLTQQNRRGALSSIEYLLDSASYVVGLHYNDLGQPSQLDYPTTSGGTPIVAKYHYQGNSGALESVTENGSGVERAVWHLDDAFQGQMASQVTFGNGAVSTFDYDSARHWLKTIDTTLSGASIQSLEYSHYDDGQVHERTTPNRTQEYTYDPLGRLKTLTTFASGVSDAPHGFDYDSHGNLTQKDAVSSSFQHPETPHLPTLVGGNAYTYHPNGNLLSRGGADVPGQLQLFSYTPFDLPREILTGATTQHRTQFEYTADEARVVRRDPDTDTTRYYVGDLYQRVVNNSGATIEERFRINAGGVVAEIVRTLGQEKTLYLHADHLGTPDTISDGQGNSAHQEYGPFGELQGTPAFINIFGTHLGFTGHQEDFDLGLTDMHGRVFDPLAARFTTADPIMQAPFFSQGQNRYAYVLNDPINLTDPSGFAFDTSGDLFAQGHIVGDSMTALVAVAATVGLSYGIGSELASAGVDMEVTPSSIMPTGPASATATAIGVVTLVQDVASLAEGPDHSGESSRRIVAAPSAAPRGPKIKPRSTKPTANNRGGPPVPQPRGEWDGLDDGEWRKLKEGPSVGRVPNKLLEHPSMKGDPNAAEFIDGLLPDFVLAGVPGAAIEEAIIAQVLKDGGIFLRASRGGYRLHGKMPDNGVLRKMATRALVELREITRTSIVTREAEMLRLGAKGGHALRLGQERRLLKALDELLRNLGIP